MMERVSLVHVLEVRVHSQRQQMFDLLDSIVVVSLDNFDQRRLVIDITEICLTLILSQLDHELILTVVSCIEDWQRFGGILTVRVQAVGQQVFENMLAYVLIGKMKFCVEQVSFFDILAEQMKRGHLLRIHGIEVSYFIFEVAH